MKIRSIAKSVGQRLLALIIVLLVFAGIVVGANKVSPLFAPAARQPQKPQTVQIGGILESVEYLNPPQPSWGHSDCYTVVRFTDGRVKSFWGISQETFQAGKQNIITYPREGTPYILKVEIKEN